MRVAEPRIVREYSQPPYTKSTNRHGQRGLLAARESKKVQGEATGRACLPLPRSRAFWLWTKAEKALAHGRDRGIPRPLPKESARAMRAAGGAGRVKMLGASSCQVATIFTRAA